MMRKPWGGLCAAILAGGLALPSAWGAPDSQPEDAVPVRVLAVESHTGPLGTSLQVRTSGPFSFTAYQPHERSLIVDLAGVVADPATLESSSDVTWVADYRLLPFRNARGRQVLRLDLGLRQDCAVEVTQPEASTLNLACPQGSEGNNAAAEAAAAVAASEPAAVTPEAPAATVHVRRVVVHEQAQGVIVDIEATGPLAYETLTLENPTRLVVDLPQSILLLKTKRRFSLEAEAVAGVRVGQFRAQPPVTRLVVDLHEMVSYQLTPRPDGLRLVLQPATASVAALDTLAEPAPPRENVNEVEEKKPEERPALEESPAPTTVLSQHASADPGPVLLASLAPTVPASLSAAVPEPAESAEPDAVMRPSVPSTKPASVAAPKPRVEVAPPPAAFALQEEGAPPEYAGEPISVNLKDVDLKDFFRLIHEISGLNIVIDPNVSGTVTLVLIDVPWDQALDIVLRNNRLGSTLEGNVLRIATLDTLKDEQDEQRELAEARALAVDPVTVTRTLSYAQAEDLEPTLRRFLSTRGEIIQDERTNTLIIRDIPTVLPGLDNLIQQLDRKSQQVEIEARVVSASRAFMREIGSQLATSFSNNQGRNIFGGALGASSLNQGLLGTPVPPPPLISAGGDPGTQPLAVDLPAAPATSGFLFGHRSPDFALDVILTAAENRNIAKILSKPRLITQNNVQGEVKQGTRIPVQTVINNTISTQFLDVVLRLRVTPQITAEGTVFLDIIVENEAIDPGVQRINGIPAIRTQSTTTQVLIEDGGTVVIGGVMNTSNSTNIDQVPLLGSIPIIGHLFKRTRVDTDTQELLFFITPRILPS
ncbi:MAG: type IV pilus secretin PilQ [Terriglobia bacterium]